MNTQEKTLTIRIQSKKLGVGIQRLAFRFGFKWNDGLCKVRDCGENKNYFIRFDFPNGTMEYFSPFREDDIGEYIQFQNSYEVESDFDNPPELIALKRAFQRYARRIEVHQGPQPERKPNVKYSTWIREKNRPIEHMRDIVGHIDEI